MRTKKIRLRITKSHIALGIGGDNLACPIALAVRQALSKKYAQCISVSNKSIKIGKPGCGNIGPIPIFDPDFCFDLPIKARVFIANFDTAFEHPGKPSKTSSDVIKPFSFTIILPDKMLRTKRKIRK